MNCISKRIIINQKLYVCGVRSFLRNERTFQSSYRLNHVFTYNRKSINLRNFKLNNITLVRLASTTVYENKSVLENESLNSLKDVSFDFSQSQTDSFGFVTDLTTEIAAKVVEPTLTSLGLGGISPWGLLQLALEYLHVNQGLPWWGTVVVTTVILRLLTVNFAIKSRNAHAKMLKFQPIIKEFQEKQRQAMLKGNEYEAKLYAMECYNLMKKENFNPMTTMVPALVQGVVFVSFFWALYPMASLPVESLQTGGVLWFTDLTHPDPYYIMPVFCGGTMGYLLQSGAEGILLPGASPPFIKAILYFLPVGAVIFSSHFPSLIILYWATNNMLSLIQFHVLKTEAAKKFFNLEDAP